MPSPTPLPVRRAVFDRFRRGESVAAIAAELDRPARTVRHLVRQFRERGEEALAPRYGAARPAAPDEPARTQALACRREHPSWGAPLIRSILLRQGSPAPSARTLQ